MAHCHEVLRPHLLIFFILALKFRSDERPHKIYEGTFSFHVR